MKSVVQVIVILFVLGGLSYALLRWLGSGGPDPDSQVQTPAQQALALAESRGCVACHSLDGARGIGPSWQGSWGTQRRFADGTSAVVDAAYLREAMLAPAARVVESFDNVMLPTGFTDAEIALITDFIRSLQPAAVQAE
jgi:cytochrome c oxidase subunit 2